MGTGNDRGMRLEGKAALIVPLREGMTKAELEAVPARFARARRALSP